MGRQAGDQGGVRSCRCGGVQRKRPHLSPEWNVDGRCPLHGVVVLRWRRKAALGSHTERWHVTRCDRDLSASAGSSWGRESLSCPFTISVGFVLQSHQWSPYIGARLATGIMEPGFGRSAPAWDIMGCKRRCGYGAGCPIINTGTLEMFSVYIMYMQLRC